MALKTGGDTHQSVAGKLQELHHEEDEGKVCDHHKLRNGLLLDVDCGQYSLVAGVEVPLITTRVALRKVHSYT